MEKYFHFLKTIFLNLLTKKDVVIISERSNWSIQEDAKALHAHLSDQTRIAIRFYHQLIRNKIIHFMSINTLINKNGVKKVHPSNKVILTWYHILENDPRLNLIKELTRVVSVIHTACQETKEKLCEAGFPKERIIVIPLAVDLEKFFPLPKNKKSEARKGLQLPKEKTIIGSFQKDGEGWGDGLTPKYIKGPDILCDSLRLIHKEIPIHILLTGPARGYVKKNLEKSGIPYTHFYVNDPKELNDFYNAIDLYLITSRIEGGPKSLIESWSSGTPIVTTNVGMCRDFVVNEQNALLSSLDPQEISQKSIQILKNQTLKETLVNNGLDMAQELSSHNMMQNYWEKLYKPLLKQDGET